MTCCRLFPPHSSPTLDDVPWSLSDLLWYRTSKQNGLLFERWMMKRTFVFGFERAETRMPFGDLFHSISFHFLPLSASRTTRAAVNLSLGTWIVH